MRPTKQQKERRKRSFKFTDDGRPSWFYLYSGIASFHQPTLAGQNDVHGLRINTLINALKKCGYIALFLCLPVVVEAAEFQTLASTELGKADLKVGGSVHVASGKNGCVKYIKDGETVVRETCRTPKQVIVPYNDFLVMLSKVEHKDKLLNQCAAERGILIKLNDENGTIKRLNLRQVEALEGEAEARRKLGETQEQIVRAMEQKLSELTNELTREKRLSRYKSEAFWMGVMGAVWLLN